MLLLAPALASGSLLHGQAAPRVPRSLVARPRAACAPSCMARGFGPIEEQRDYFVDGEDDDELDAGPTSEEIDARRDRMLSKWADFVQLGGAKEQKTPVLVELRDVTVEFGGRAVLKNASWAVREGQLVGVLGESGCGKSTQLRVLAGQLEPEAGTIERSDGLRVSHVAQGAEATLLSCEQTLREFAARMCASGDADEAAAAAEAEARVLEALRGTDGSGGGDDSLLLQQRVGTLSPGQRARLCVVAALASSPTLLLLDEPTNHLDLDGLEWLEEQILSARREGRIGAAVLVSHDREFLEHVCTHTLDASAGEPRLYLGGFTAYLELREQRQETLEQLRQEEAKAAAAEGSPEQRLKPARFRLSHTATRGGKKKRGGGGGGGDDGDVVLGLSGAEVRFGGGDAAAGAAVLRGTELTLRRGERLLLLGANGAGKSTLLRAALGLQPLTQGSVHVADGVQPFYFSQDAAELLAEGEGGEGGGGGGGGGGGEEGEAMAEGLSVMEAALRAQPHAAEEAVRKSLKQMGLPREMHSAPVAKLSGGERARFCLAQMLVSRAELLLLDEPTNHLDLCAREALEEALRYFEGTLLLVSHDRYFGAQVTSQVAVLADGQLRRHDGDYRDYIRRNDALLGRLSGREREGASLPLLSTDAPKLRTAGGKVLVDGREVNARQAKSRKRMRKPKPVNSGPVE